MPSCKTVMNSLAPGRPRDGEVRRRFEFLERLRIELLSGLPTAAMTVTTSATFIHVFGSWAFFWPLVRVALLAHLLVAIVRTVQYSLPPAVFAPIALLAPVTIVYCCVGWLRFRDSLWSGLPLTRTWAAIWSDLQTSLDLIGEVVTPVDFGSGFGTMAMVVIGFIAVTTDAFAVRYGGRVEVFVPAAATLFIVAAVGTEGERVPIAAIWIAVAFVSAHLIRRDHSRRHELHTVGRTKTSPPGAFVRAGFGALAFAAIVGVVAAVVAPTLPGAGEEAWLTQRSRTGGAELEPLVDVRRQLTDPSPTVLFTVRAQSPAYWRMASLPDFDGSRWTIPRRVLDSAAGELSPPLGSVEPGVESVLNLQKFTIEGLAGNLTPVAASPTRLRASTQSLFYEPESGSLLVGTQGLRPQDSYEIQSTMLLPSPDRLARATSRTPPSDSYLELPESDSISRLREVAFSIVPSEAPPYERALALQDYFRNGFTYSLDVPPIEDADATLQFLERRSGYCEHFASTFALFARFLDLPSRVAIGFTPGDRADSDSGAAVYTVRSMHAHAWPEVWFDGIGWVLFEPTPGRGAPNASYTNVPEEQAVEPEPPPTSPSTTTTLTPNVIAPSTTIGPAAPGQASSNPRSGNGMPWPWVLIVGIPALLALWVAGLPRIFRRIVLGRIDSPILWMWRRAVALYELERGTFASSLSPLEVATRATSRLYDDDTFIFELADLATLSLFSDSTADRDGDENFLARGETYLRDRRRRLPVPLRLRARLDPLVVWRLEGGRWRS